MLDVIFSSNLISGGLNYGYFCIDWNKHGEICAALGAAVAFTSLTELDMVVPNFDYIRFPHRDKVTVVKWTKCLNNVKDESMVSSSTSNELYIWKKTNGRYETSHRLGTEDFPSVITDVMSAAYVYNQKKYILVVAMSLKMIKIWKIIPAEGIVDVLQVIEEPKDTGTSGISITLLPGTETAALFFPKNMKQIWVFTEKLKTFGSKLESQPLDTNIKGWIHDIDAETVSDRVTLIASAGQNGTVRVYFMSLESDMDLEDRSRSSITRFKSEGKEFACILMNILSTTGFEVHTVQWNISSENDKSLIQLIGINSSAMVFIWQYNSDGMEVRSVVGKDIDNPLFLSARINPTGRMILVNDYCGSLHLWKLMKGELGEEKWVTASIQAGHNSKITSLEWDPNGQFVITGGDDKTVRVYAPWKQDYKCWYEFARPLSHGYPIVALAVLPECRFLCSGVEKEIRSFLATSSFIRYMNRNSFLREDESKYSEYAVIQPSLDLSNKPVPESELPEEIRIGDTLREPESIPSIESLMAKTLWPEAQKMFFHPSNVTCITATHDGSLIASSNEAKSESEAVIAIWHVKRWDLIRRVQELLFHHLTVADMKFSRDGNYLLVVARDRSWSLWKLNKTAVSEADPNAVGTFELHNSSLRFTTVYRRALHGCAWSHDSLFFAIVGNGAPSIIWERDDRSGESTSEEESSSDDDQLKKKDSCSERYPYYALVKDVHGEATSVSFAPGFFDSESKYMFAVGYSDGTIVGYWLMLNEEPRYATHFILSAEYGHCAAVMHLAFRPVFGIAGHEEGASSSKGKHQHVQLASAGERLLRIYTITFVIA